MGGGVSLGMLQLLPVINRGHLCYILYGGQHVRCFVHNRAK